jgi:BA14K-like protein
MSLPLKALALGLMAASAPAGTAYAQSASAPPAQSVAWRGGWHGGWGGWGPAAVGGAIVGGALAAATSPFWGYGPYAYDYGPYAYGYGPGVYAAPTYSYEYSPGYSSYGLAAPAGGGVAYCEQRFRSYDPATGTYLGYDGIRHSCP